MARISAWFVRAALVHFLLGATAGAWRLAATSGQWPKLPVSLGPLHVEVMLIGWVCQLALGVALWILPFSDQVSSDRRLWGAWAALNSGIALVGLAPLTYLPGLQVVGRSAEIVAGLLIIRVLWPRVRGLPNRGQRESETQKE